MTSSVRGPSIQEPRRSEAALFARFLLVGVCGFVVDGGILFVLVRESRADPIAARLVSFSMAVLCTYTLNRVWTFQKSVEFWRGLGNYLTVQSLGFCCNLAVYTTLLFVLPSRWALPVFCLAIASVCALVVNYVGTRWIVFRVPR